MYGIALSVRACLQGGTRVDVAWNLDPQLTPGFDATDAVGLTPGGGRLGSLLGGAIDSRLIEEAAAQPSGGRVLEIELNPVEALVIGVEPGTTLRVFATPAARSSRSNRQNLRGPPTAVSQGAPVSPPASGSRA